MFVDVNLRNPWWDAKTVSDLADGARWCKLNDIELASLAGPGEAVLDCAAVGVGGTISVPDRAAEPHAFSCHVRGAGDTVSAP